MWLTPRLCILKFGPMGSVRTFETAIPHLVPGTSKLLPSGRCLSENTPLRVRNREADMITSAIPFWGLRCSTLKCHSLSCLTTSPRSLHFHERTFSTSSLGHMQEHFEQQLDTVHSFATWSLMKPTFMTLIHSPLLLFVSQLNDDHFTTITTNSVRHHGWIIRAQHSRKSEQFPEHAERWCQHGWRRKPKSNNLDHQQYSLHSGSATHAHCSGRCQHSFGYVGHFANMVWLVESK